MRYCVHTRKLELNFESISIYGFNLTLLSDEGYNLNQVKYDHIGFFNSGTKKEILIYPSLELDMDKGVSKKAKDAAKDFQKQLQDYMTMLTPYYEKEVRAAYEYFSSK